MPFTLEGQNVEEHARNPLANFEAVDASYFRTMRMPLVEGRLFTEADGPDAPQVAVVSASFARRYWPGRTAVGRRITSGPPDGESRWKTIVGVVGDVRYRDWTSVRFDLYVPYQQWSFGRMDLVVRTSGDPRAAIRAVQRAVYSLDSDLPLASVTTMEDAIAGAVAGPRFTALLLALFAGMALLLAAVGTYGVISWSVHQRTREIGVRIAIGATPRGVVRLVVREALTTILAGVACGAALALMAGRVLGGLLFEVSPTDPLALALTAVLLIATGLAAALLAAARVVRVDPAVALRY